MEWKTKRLKLLIKVYVEAKYIYEEALCVINTIDQYYKEIDNINEFIEENADVINWDIIRGVFEDKLSDDIKKKFRCEIYPSFEIIPNIVTIDKD